MYPYGFPSPGIYDDSRTSSSPFSSLSSLDCQKSIDSKVWSHSSLEDEELLPLEHGRPTSSTSTFRRSRLAARLSSRLRQDIDTDDWLTDLSLLLICFSSAAERLLTRWDFGCQIFGQTGNLAELLAPQVPFRASLAMSSASWCLAVAVTGQCANKIDVKSRRWWLLLLMLLQLLLIKLAIVLPGYPLHTSTAEEDSVLVVKVSLLSL